MMNLTLYRFHASDFDTVGLLYVDGVFASFVLEDAYHKEKVYGKTRIPAGKYRIVLDYSPKMSPKYGHDMLTVANVPNYTGIRIHKGNTEDDTEGCLLLGLLANASHGGRSSIMRSTEAYNYVYPLVSEGVKAGETWIEIVDEQHHTR